MFTISNKAYDTLKAVAQYALPAAGAFYFALAQIWNLPYAKEVVGTITALDAFLGVMLGINTAQYNKKLNEEEVEARLPERP